MIEKRGVKAARHDNLILQVDQKEVVDFSLDLGEVSQTVTVTGAVPLVKSESAELGEVITGPAVRSLPLNGRNFAQLVYLVPGVTTGQQGENLSGASTFNPRAASDYNALGSQANTNAWLVDGIDNNEYTFNTVIVQPSVESIGEFKVLTGTFSAEFGRGAGVVSVSTKSGTNQFHGSAFEFLRNSYLDARNYFNAPFLKGIYQPVPPFRRNQFGASFGGPVVLPRVYNGHERTFFFVDYYGLREFSSEEHTSELQSRRELVCRLLLEKKNCSYKIQRVELHELNQSHGLKHSSIANTIMNPDISSYYTLSADDISGALALYGTPTGTPT